VYSVVNILSEVGRNKTARLQPGWVFPALRLPEKLPLLLTLLTYMTHRDVVAAIAPCNLAAFPPSLEVNADIA
jgi:hypothetical protein